MLTTKTTKHQDPRGNGEVTTRHLEGTIVESVYTGYCTRALVQSVLDITPEVLREVPGTCWLLDLSGATDADADARVPGLSILKLFKENGGDRFAVVVTWGPLRMIMTAVAFTAGLPIKLFNNREDALAFLRARTAGNHKKGSAAQL